MSHLDTRWCCLNCNSTMRVGEMKLGFRQGYGFVCPLCGSDNTHPADGTSHKLTEYHGEVGTKN
jgi:hypothetical protein